MQEQRPKLRTHALESCPELSTSEGPLSQTPIRYPTVGAAGQLASGQGIAVGPVDRVDVGVEEGDLVDPEAPHREGQVAELRTTCVADGYEDLS